MSKWMTKVGKSLEILLNANQEMRLSVAFFTWIFVKLETKIWINRKNHGQGPHRKCGESRWKWRREEMPETGHYFRASEFCSLEWLIIMVIITQILLSLELEGIEFNYMFFTPKLKLWSKTIITLEYHKAELAKFDRIAALILSPC